MLPFVATLAVLLPLVIISNIVYLGTLPSALPLINIYGKFVLICIFLFYFARTIRMMKTYKKSGEWVFITILFVSGFIYYYSSVFMCELSHIFSSVGTCGIEKTSVDYGIFTPLARSIPPVNDVIIYLHPHLRIIGGFLNYFAHYFLVLTAFISAQVYCRKELKK